jgi:hypothetical protein
MADLSVRVSGCLSVPRRASPRGRSGRDGVAGERLNREKRAADAACSVPDLLWRHAMMGRIMVLALMVLAVWVGAEVYTKGLDGAFGGAFTSALETRKDGTASDGTSDAFQRAYNKSEERVERLLE